MGNRSFCPVIDPTSRGTTREAVSDGGGVGGAAGWGWRRCEVALLGVGLAR